MMTQRDMNLAEAMRRVLNKESLVDGKQEEPRAIYVSRLRIDRSELIPKNYTVQIVFTVDAKDELDLFKRISSVTQICIEEK